MSRGQAPEGLNDSSDYYTILDLRPDAKPSEIREAYFRAKATYQKDNVALYTLIDSGDREDMLRRVEEAYQVLSNSERRRDYDRLYGQISSPSPFSAAPAPERAKVISIDRTAPMEATGPDENPLDPPRTDSEPRFNTHYAGGMDTARRTPSAFQQDQHGHAPGSGSVMPPPPVKQPEAAAPCTALNEMENEILEQTDWSGPFIRRVREARGVSIEEVTQATRITKAYIVAIEDENYAKLPAAVFIRGFVAQLARLLKLPHQQVAASYMGRLQKAHPEKFR